MKTKLCAFALILAFGCGEQYHPTQQSTNPSSSTGKPDPIGGRVLADCSSNSQCPSGYVCVNGACTRSCSSSNPCPSGYQCVSGVCQLIPVPPCSPCGGSYSDSYSTINQYHIYSSQTSIICGAGKISINCYVADIPNRFTFKDQNGNILYTTSWLGYANYPGQWGMSLSTNNTFTVPLISNTSHQITSVTVITETQTPPNYNYSPTTDYWSVNIGCQF